jgi:hypothetical protein
MEAMGRGERRANRVHLVQATLEHLIGNTLGEGMTARENAGRELSLIGGTDRTMRWRMSTMGGRLRRVRRVHLVTVVFRWVVTRGRTPPRSPS